MTKYINVLESYLIPTTESFNTNEKKKAFSINIIISNVGRTRTIANSIIDYKDRIPQSAISEFNESLMDIFFYTNKYLTFINRYKNTERMTKALNVLATKYINSSVMQKDFEKFEEVMNLSDSDFSNPKMKALLRLFATVSKAEKKLIDSLVDILEK